MDPKIISLDIETYGAAKADDNGLLLPKQRVFNPIKSLYIDEIDKERMVLTVAITLLQEDTRGEDWDVYNIAKLKPGKTFVLEMNKESHRECLANWLRYADTLIGMNIQFDLLYLRMFDTRFRHALKDQQLIDPVVLNYLFSELRGVTSLKALGPLLGQFTYKETLQGGNRFSSSNSPELAYYNAQDTHNTILAAAELSRQIVDSFPTTEKGSAWCLKFYSDVIWSVVNMSEVGIPFSSVKLEGVLNDMKKQIDESIEGAEKCGLILEGTGSSKSKAEFMDEIITLIQETTFPEILHDLDKTKVKKQVCFSKNNRLILSSKFPKDMVEGMNAWEDSPLFKGMNHANKHSEAQKILSSYCFPLLFHRRNKREDRSSIVIPWDRCPPTKPMEETLFKCIEEPKPVSQVLENYGKTAKYTPPSEDRFDSDRTEEQADCAAYPSWFITPSHIKEAQGSSGGTIQGRITCKDPHAQTFPSIIKDCITSRFKGGSILSMDLSQIELRVAALLSGEYSMMQNYREGKDLHADRARSLWSDYDEDLDEQKQKRQVGKMMNFADLFLSSAGTMKNQVYSLSNGSINLPPEFYEEVVRKRSQTRPQLHGWQLSLMAEAKRTRMIILPLTGQSRTFIGNLNEHRSEIVNFPVQTTASNLMLRLQSEMTKELNRRFKTSKRKPLIFLQVFDAIYIDCPLGTSEAAKNSFNRIFEREKQPTGYWGMLSKILGRTVPLEYDCDIG